MERRHSFTAGLPGCSKWRGDPREGKGLLPLIFLPPLTLIHPADSIRCSTLLVLLS